MVLVKKFIADVRGPAGYGSPTAGADQTVISEYIKATSGPNPVRTALENVISELGFVANVKQYGAKGNGTADDTRAIELAMAAVEAAGGGTVFFPPATYYVPGVIELVSNVILTGPGAVLVKKNNTEPSYAFFATHSNGATGYGSGGRNIRVDMLEFRGSLTNSRDACAFALHHAADVIISGCTIRDMCGLGHVVDLGGCEDITIRDNTFLGAQNNGSRAEAIQIDLSAVGAVSVLDAPGSYDALPTRRVTVDNNRFLPLTVGGTKYPAPVPLGSHAVWEGRWYEDISFINNTVVEPRVHTGTNPVGIIHFSAIDGLTVSNNRFICKGDFGGRVIGIYSAASGRAAGDNPNTNNTHVTFTNPMVAKNINITNDNYFEGWTSTAAQVVYIDGAEDVDVSGNSWRGCASMYDIRETDGLTSSGNKFRRAAGTLASNVVNLNKVTSVAAQGNMIDCRGAGTISNIVYISNLSAAGRFTGNTVLGQGAGGITQIAGSTLDITGNTTS